MPKKRRCLKLAKNLANGPKHPTQKKLAKGKGRRRKPPRSR